MTTNGSRIQPSPEFGSYYRSFLNAILFRWVDFRKKHIVRLWLGDRAGLRILDLGCGTAAISGPLARSHEVYGIDADPTLLQQASAAGLKPLAGTFETIPTEDGFFDAVLMIDTLEHVESRERTFEEVKRVLNKSGRFLVITPNYGSALWVIGEHFAWAVTNRAASGHISPWTEEALRYWLSRNFESWRIGRINCGMWLYADAAAKRRSARSADPS